MKRKLLILSVLAICIATLAAGTLAYFTAEGKAHNVITTGGVEIAVQEWADEDKQTPFENLNGVMPDTKVTKIAEIRNTGAAAAWVRVQVRKTIRLAQDGKPDASMIQMIYTNTEDWKDGGDGYFYYQKALQPGEVTTPIFTGVTFRAEMGNEYQNATANVDVLAQAVQAANNGKTVADASGWPADTKGE